uniref:Hereditary hemochromatosis protein homolog n=1 Tax=Sinocyclocheilus rhinocerous TaxID=307959 RepID=A0A673NME7_9TELE
TLSVVNFDKTKCMFFSSSWLSLTPPLGQVGHFQFIGCAFNNEGQVSRFWRYGYDGRDIMHVDLAKEAVVATSEPGQLLAEERKIKYILYLFEKDQEYLKCAVHGFYPNIIRVRWTQNRRPVYFGVSTTGVLPHKDGTFQMISYLSLSNVSAQSVTCEIEHLSIDGILRIAYGKNLCFYHKSQRLYLRQWLPFFSDLLYQCA